jgi:aerobic carbon-monoxide dehydrogenase large subunit
MAPLITPGIWLRNYIPDDAYPSKTRTGLDLDALSHQKCRLKLLEIIDLPVLRAENDTLRPGNIHRGIGFASFVERTATNAPSNAHIRKDGIALMIDPPAASLHCRPAVSCARSFRARRRCCCR